MAELELGVRTVLRRYAVHGHYRASVGTRKYAVFSKRADGSAEQASEPMLHREAQIARENLIVRDLLELIGGEHG